MIRFIAAIILVAAAYCGWDSYLRLPAGKAIKLAQAPAINPTNSPRNNPTNAWLLRAQEMERNLRKLSQLSSNNHPTQP